MQKQSNKKSSQCAAAIRALSPWLVSGGLLTTAGGVWAADITVNSLR